MRKRSNKVLLAFGGVLQLMNLCFQAVCHGVKILGQGADLISGCHGAAQLIIPTRDTAADRRELMHGPRQINGQKQHHNGRKCHQHQGHQLIKHQIAVPFLDRRRDIPQVLEIKLPLSHLNAAG